MGDIITESLGVHSVSEGKEGWQLREGFIVESVEVGKVTGLVDLVDVCLFRCELDIVSNLLADGS